MYELFGVLCLFFSFIVDRVHTPTTILIHLDILENGTNKVGSCCVSQGSAQDSQCDGNQTHVTKIKAGLQESIHLCLEEEIIYFPSGLKLELLTYKLYSIIFTIIYNKNLLNTRFCMSF